MITLFLFTLTLLSDGATFITMNYDQGIIYGDMYIQSLTSSGVLGQTNFLDFTGGCFNTCPAFSAVSDPKNELVWMLLNDGTGILSIYQVDMKLNHKLLITPPGFLNLFIYNGNPYVEVFWQGENNTIGSAIQSWNPTANTTRTITNFTTDVGFFQNVATDEENGILYGLSTDYSQGTNSLCSVNLLTGAWTVLNVGSIGNIVSMSYSVSLKTLFLMDINCSIWNLDIITGKVNLLLKSLPSWPSQTYLNPTMVLNDETKSVYIMINIFTPGASNILARGDLVARQWQQIQTTGTPPPQTLVIGMGLITE